MKHKLGILYKIQEGIYCTKRKFLRSDPNYSKTSLHIQINEGTTHYFTETHLGPTITYDNRQILTKYLLGYNKTTGPLINVQNFPQRIIDHYRLYDVDLITITVIEQDKYKDESLPSW